VREGVSESFLRRLIQLYQKQKPVASNDGPVSDLYERTGGHTPNSSPETKQPVSREGNRLRSFDQLHQSALHGDLHRFSTIGRFKLGKNGTDVEFSGALGDMARRDLFVAGLAASTSIARGVDVCLRAPAR
jgi:hypothetical protein